MTATPAPAAPLAATAPPAMVAAATVPAEMVAAVPIANGAGDDEQQPSQAEMDAAKAKVQQLTNQEQAGTSAVTNATQAVQLAAQQSGLALETYTDAVRTLATAQATEKQQQDRLTAAQAAVDQSQNELGQWARQAYQDGSLLSTHATLNALLQVDDTQDVGTALSVLRRIGNSRNNALDAVEAARREQAAATEAAANASDAAAAAAVDATNARNEADDALATQRTELAKAQTALSGTRSELSDAKQRQTSLEAQQYLGSSGGSYVGSASTGANRVTGPTGSCTGGDNIEQYPDGQIPLSALCALATAPGQYLRADAAYAFDRMSNAYAQRFGTPICVTDSYRTLAAQIDLYKRKPNLAAKPGTSNHGWGTAVDLGCGIQDFGSAQHHWMQLNAPLYNWFHPAWAQADGSRPEPWHWEFAG